MPNFSGVNFGKIRKAVKFPVEFPVESKSGRIHSKVSGTGKKCYFTIPLTLQSWKF